MLDKIGKFFNNIKVVSSVLATFIVSMAFAGNTYTDYKLEKYITVAGLDNYMSKRDVSALVRRIEYLTLDLRNATPEKRQMIHDKIALINTQIRQIKGN